MLKEMKAYGHMKPGQKGTQRLVNRFGAALVCVRYRYDERTGDNLTTAEVIVDRRPGWRPAYGTRTWLPLLCRTLKRRCVRN
jgi:hypothetical protein